MKNEFGVLERLVKGIPMRSNFKDGVGIVWSRDGNRMVLVTE